MTNNERYIKKNVVIGLAIALGLIVSILSSISFAVAQVASVEITSPANGKPYGGAPIGKLDLFLDGDNIRFVGKMNSSPQANKVFEGWLVDAGNRASNYNFGLCTKYDKPLYIFRISSDPGAISRLGSKTFFTRGWCTATSSVWSMNFLFYS